MWKTGVLNIILILIAMGCSTLKESGAAKVPLQMYSFGQLDSLMQIDKRPVAVFLYTEWCRFCNHMKQTTFQEPAVADLLNRQYYFIPFDGEQKEAVRFGGQTFHFQPTGRSTGTHSLAAALGTINDKLSYPSFVLLNPAYEITFQHNTFIGGTEMEQLLKRGIQP